jgi:rhomboid protease GluP
MDLNHIALWLAELPALSLFFRSARAPQRSPGWMGVTALVLLTGLVGWFSFHDYAGYVAGLLALLFVLLPIWTHNAGVRASARSQYRRARYLFRIAALLHPLDGWLLTPQLVHAFELAHAGQPGDADALLRVLARGTGSAARTAEAQRLRILCRWRELKTFVEQSGLTALSREPALLAHYLRALGELGELERLAEIMRAQERALIASGTLDVGLVYLFAFSGQLELTRQVLSGGHGASQETRELWLAIASHSAGEIEQARRTFVRLRQSADPELRRRAEDNLSDSVGTGLAGPVTARTREIVRHFAAVLTERRNLIPNGPGQRGQRQMTVLLIAGNVLVYVTGSYPGFFDTQDSFVKRWAFFAPDIFEGEWWRVLSYCFVHANATHLVMNLAGLWVLGPFVERVFGRLRFGLIYLVSGCAGSALYLTLSLYRWITPEPLVGASGCIMGLLGATAAVMLRAWVGQRAAIARQIFLRLLLVVALQVAFDLSTPQVAGLAHALGLIGGFVAGLLLQNGVNQRAGRIMIADQRN